MKKEPKTNTFIKPWNGGMLINTFSSPYNKVSVRLMLLLVGCDIPACRKLCGFLDIIFFSLSCYY